MKNAKDVEESKQLGKIRTKMKDLHYLILKPTVKL